MRPPSGSSGADERTSQMMNEHATAADSESRATNQRAVRQALTFPLEQAIRLQSEAAQFVVDTIESGSAAQQRSLDMTADLVRNYAQTLERTTRDTEQLATAGLDAFQQSQQLVGGQQPPQQRAQPWSQSQPVAQQQAPMPAEQGQPSTTQQYAQPQPSATQQYAQSQPSATQQPQYAQPQPPATQQPQYAQQSPQPPRQPQQPQFTQQQAPLSAEQGQQPSQQPQPMGSQSLQQAPPQREQPSSEQSPERREGPIGQQ